ncbi:sensor histidine kinase [Rhodovibrio salinarum]|uniref:histidine kinase n=1 Tax=Rhodovibrio salinarum TaxID=1087 RepID=A0A934UZT5_9PROT|nr:HAMP domain-containing sensor histidine kinase [Rhodovibrio salinarum]MBK1696730.1 sensor histidine kinase [Rhodovibrio salinarum]
MTRARLSLPSPVKGLSVRLLVLTIFFVMLAEVLIFVPSIARYRLSYLEEKLASAHLAVLALEATPDQMVSEELEGELLDYVGAHSIALKRPDRGKLMLMREPPGPVHASYDLRGAGAFALIADAFGSLTSPGDRVIRVVGTSPHQPNAMVEVVIEEKPLCQAMFAFGERILVLSLAISLITAALVYVALHLMMVRPMRRVTASMTRFREDPEDVTAQIQPSNRTDEIGVAERELASMQGRLATALHQKTRLAALGIAVTKVSHDLKNILASARLVSDRLADSGDPDVRRLAPTLVKTIDRAVHLCQQTLNFTQEGPPRLEISRFDLAMLVEDIAGEIAAAQTSDSLAAGPVVNHLPTELEVEADRDQLYRVFSNLLRNAVEAGATRVEVAAQTHNGDLSVTIADDGPGLPPRVRDNIFQPFSGTMKQGGTGLGLAIARDLVRAHGGDITLTGTDASGTAFQIELPRRAKTGRPRRGPGSDDGGNRTRTPSSELRAAS